MQPAVGKAAALGMIQAQGPRAAWFPVVLFSPSSRFPGPFLFGNCPRQSGYVPEDEHVGPFYFEIFAVKQK